MRNFKTDISISPYEMYLNSSYRRVPDIRSIIVNLDCYHTTNRPAACANENWAGYRWLPY